MALCNFLANSSFESGALSPWTPSAVDAIKVAKGTNADDGDYYLDLQTAIGNRPNSISQPLTGLDTAANYTVSVAIQIPPESSAANYCGVYVYTGPNSTSVTASIISEVINKDAFGGWLPYTGHFQPTATEDLFHVASSCTFSDSSYTGRAYIDSVEVGGC